MAADDQEYYGYYYATEEDRGLLDPAWERQQRKVIPRKPNRDYCSVLVLSTK